MIERTLFNPEHESFRDSFRRFMDKEIAPFHAQWEEQGFVDREVWRKAGANGFLCMTIPEAYGGAGADKLYSVVQMEELSRGGFSGIGFGFLLMRGRPGRVGDRSPVPPRPRGGPRTHRGCGTGGWSPGRT